MSRELDARVAEAMGYRFWLEQRGEYRMAVMQRPGDREPWTRYRDRTAGHYEECSASVALAMGFFGTGIPDFSTDPAACEEVKREIRRRTFNHDISWSSGGYLVTLKGGCSNHIGSHHCEYTAICLAFLAAVGAEKGAKN